MNTDNKLNDMQMAAFISAVTIIGGVAIYWITQVDTPLDLLEMVYGSAKLFNNPLDF
ncbi:MAG: hypothetical protein IIC21_04025 [Chloroflexi bacterium]|nr:hypothetical protein [Chloroflexota bacterium]